MAKSIANPILNSPYDPPQRHFEIGPGGPTGVVLEGRRPSESFIPIAQARKGRRVTGKIAVKVINDYGDEVMKVFDVG